MKSLIESFMSLPTWVKIWVLAILIPANMMGLLFWEHEVGRWMAVLGLAGMLPNMLVMYVEKAITKTMALPHIIPWTILVIYLAIKLFNGEVPDGNIYYAACALLVIDIISLCFDYKESLEWFQERKHK